MANKNTFLKGMKKLSNDGVVKTVQSITYLSIKWCEDKFSKSKNDKLLTRILLFPLYQLYLICEEGAIAYPATGKGWQILHLRGVEKGRRLPSLHLMADTRHGSENHKEMMRRLYTCPELVEVESGDTVVDVGAYVGGFSLAFADVADYVIAIEPNAAFDDILQYNTIQKENVKVAPYAAWSEEKIVEMNQSKFPNENSLLDVDAGAINKSVYVDADTVPNIVRMFDIDKIDFLKIEAEGVEPEILKGVLSDDMPVAKIAVDASAERNADDCVTEIIDLFERYGYEWSINNGDYLWSNYIIFGRRDCNGD